MHTQFSLFYPFCKHNGEVILISGIGWQKSDINSLNIFSFTCIQLNEFDKFDAYFWNYQYIEPIHVIWWK